MENNELNQENITLNTPAAHERKLAPQEEPLKQLHYELTLKFDTLTKQYSMEKVLWNERTRIKDEETKSLKDQIAERENSAKTEFKKKEDEINELKAKIYEVEAKLSLEKEMARERIQFKESELKETKSRFEIHEMKLNQELAGLSSQLKFKDEETRRLNSLIAQREIELTSQIQWKQQEILLLRGRYEEEMKKITFDLKYEQSKSSEVILNHNNSLADLRSSLIKEITEFRIKYEEEKRHAEKLFAKTQEIEKERLGFMSMIDALNLRIEELRTENKTFRQVVYVPENLAKLKFIDAQNEMEKLALQISLLQKSVNDEKTKREQELAEKEREIAGFKNKLEMYKDDMSKGSSEKVVALQKEKDLLEARLAEMSLIKEAGKEGIKKLLQEKDEANAYYLDDIARGIIHKIRNLLGVVNGAIEICSATLDDTTKKNEDDKKFQTLIEGPFAELKENYGMALQHVAEMMKVVDEFREIAKPIMLDKQSVNINNFISKAAEMQVVADRAQKQNVRIEQALGASLPQVSLDTARFEYILSELFTNALDAMLKGGTLKVTTDIDAATDIVIVNVIDTGIGLPETQVGKVFQPYFTNKLNRNGLGLTKVERIVNLHNGKIIFKSEKGKGTTVSLQVPV